MKVCLDLNVWCAALISRRFGRKGSAADQLADWCMSAKAPRCPITLIGSWGMTERLLGVLVSQLATPEDEAIAYVGTIVASIASGPSLTLGGTGVLPIRDEEDRHVLETALAGGADLLVTSDFADFLESGGETLVDGRIAWVTHVNRKLLVAHPYAAAAWLAGRDVAGWPA